MLLFLGMEGEGGREKERERERCPRFGSWWSVAKMPREDSKRSRVAEGEIKNGGGLTATEA